MGKTCERGYFILLLIGAIVIGSKSILYMYGTCCWCFSEGLELCEAEVFEPDCPADHVVVITMAKYGRMKISRCVQVDYGYVGCEADVMEHLDSICSGRRKCELRIPDQSLDKAKTCPKEFKTYLNVSYRCLEGGFPTLHLRVHIAQY